MNLKGVSEIKDWKIIPRLMMLAITVMCFYVTNWMISLPDPTINQTTFSSIIFGCFIGCFAIWLGQSESSK